MVLHRTRFGLLHTFETVEWGGDGLFPVSNSYAHERIEILIEITKCIDINHERYDFPATSTKNKGIGSPTSLLLPYWTGTPTEFLELISVPILLDKLGGMGKYDAIDALYRAFGVKTDCSKNKGKRRMISSD